VRKWNYGWKDRGKGEGCRKGREVGKGEGEEEMGKEKNGSGPDQFWEEIDAPSCFSA